MAIRLSSQSVFDTGQTRLSELQASLVRMQQQISSGRRLLTAADDPVAAARALEVTQGRNVNTQFSLNRVNVKASLSQEENVLQSVTSLMQDVKTLVVNAGGALDETQRRFLVTELKGRIEELVGLANTRDAAGNYLFAGYQTTTQPFAQTSTGAQYDGDQGQRMLQVGADRQMSMSDSGDAVFENIVTGNGTFTATPAAANTGAGIISPGTVVNRLALTGHDYAIDFAVTAGPPSSTTYSVYDITADPGKTTAVTTGTYAENQPIVFDGMRVEIKGIPADLDSFAIEPSTRQSVFTTLTNLVNVLGSSTYSPADKAVFANGMNVANLHIDNAIDNILSVRASVGARLKEVESMDTAGTDRDLQYAQILSELQDLDYPKAISEFMQQSTTLEAAQKAFIKTTGLSIFNYI